jgi:ABC-type bacteriocin/lantibiotic exporter with double-glycine peptidase domain
MKEHVKVYSRFVKFVLPYRRKWLAIVALSVSGSLLSLIIPYLAIGVIDTSIGKKDYASFLYYALIGGGVFVLGEALNWSRYWLEQIIKIRVNFDLHKRVFQHLQGLSYSWFQDQSTGGHMYKVNYDIENVTGFITEALPQIVSIVPRALFIVGIVLYLNWMMALCALALAPFLFFPGHFYNRIMEKLGEKLADSSEKVLNYLQEIFSHIQLVKVWGAEKKSTRSFLHKLAANIRISARSLRPEIANGIALQIITKVIIGLITLFGGYLVIRGTITLGAMTAIMVYLTQLVGLQSQLAQFMQTSISGSISCGRIAQILDTKPAIRDAPGARSLEFGAGDIEFKKVSFGYRPGEFVIENAQFFIRGGEFVALAGPSGSGKTTILNLLARLYDPWSGALCIDTRDVRSITLRSLKDQIGFALQDPFLWDDTIFNNITYGASGATLEQVEETGRAAGVDDFARVLPSGYFTVSGENGCKLSEGQKQKIAIARALFKNPRILVLDEAMAAMDSSSEEKILLNIRQRRSHMTVIIVSHRFSTIRKCDRALYIAARDSIVAGSIDGLLKDNPGFRNLFSGQLEKI